MGVLNSGGGTLDNAGSASGTNVTGQAAGTGTDGVSAKIIGGSVTAKSITVAADSKVGVLNIVGATLALASAAASALRSASPKSIRK